MIRSLPLPDPPAARHPVGAGRDAWLQRFAARIVALFAPATVLDVGAGDGRLGVFFPIGVRYVGVDVAPCSPLVWAADAHDLPLRTGAIDAVVSKQTLDKFADPARALGECVRVARLGGVLEQTFPGGGPIGWPGRSRVVIDGPDDILGLLPAGAAWDGDCWFVWRTPREDCAEDHPREELRQ